jgi:phosphatidylinositol glycan class O
MDHPEMALKLAQMNTVIEQVIEAVDNDTIVFVLGDHGMTFDGNHGGASDHEVQNVIELNNHPYLTFW